MQGRIDRWTLPDLQAAVEWCRKRNNRGISCSLHYLGEYSLNVEESESNFAHYIDCARTIEQNALDAGLAVKPTALGALVDRDQCVEYLLKLCSETRKHGTLIEIDMEGKNLVDFTIDAAQQCVREGCDISVALQAYLDRSQDDLHQIIGSGIRVRLVKGAYMGDTTDFEEIEQRFIDLVHLADQTGKPFGIGTHDPDILIRVTEMFASRMDMIEIGFLRGLADITKESLAQRGWRVSEYVPYGSEGTAYRSRRVRYLKDLDRLGRRPIE